MRVPRWEDTDLKKIIITPKSSLPKEILKPKRQDLNS